MDMTHEKKTCVDCGSAKVKTLNEKKSYAAPFGPTVEYTSTVAACSDCHARIDQSAPEVFPSAVCESETKSIGMILEYFREHGYTGAAIERALELPQRALSNWKCKESPSRSALALLRVLRAFPFAVDVAENHFDPQYIEAMLHSIGEAYCEKPHGIQTDFNNLLVGGSSITDATPAYGFSSSDNGIPIPEDFFKQHTLGTPTLRTYKGIA